MTTIEHHIVIIGNGVSGITCARHIRKQSKNKITVISSETDYHFSRTALMYIYMGHMRYEDTKPYEDDFWIKNKINLLNKQVIQVIVKENKLIFSDGNSLQFDQLVLATGSESNFFNWPGQNLKGVQGLYSYQNLKLMEQSTMNINHAVVVGGGLIGVEMAEMLLSRNIGVTYLVRENKFWSAVFSSDESRLIEAHLRSHHVDLRLEKELISIQGDNEQRVRAVTLSDQSAVECQFVGIAVGVSPAISFLKDSGIETDKGILVNEFFETNVKDIYAIGDCAQQRNPLPGRKSVESVWYTGKIQGEALANSLVGNKFAYNPGKWFNSAKFFDIEFQTYGDVPASTTDGISEFLWKHEDNLKSIRVVYHTNSRVFTGMNTLGIRIRHVLMDQWLRENRTIDFVVDHLQEAVFDPEFYKPYHQLFQKAFEFGSNSIKNEP